MVRRRASERPTQHHRALPAWRENGRLEMRARVSDPRSASLATSLHSVGAPATLLLSTVTLGASPVPAAWLASLRSLTLPVPSTTIAYL